MFLGAAFQMLKFYFYYTGKISLSIELWWLSTRLLDSLQSSSGGVVLCRGLLHTVAHELALAHLKNIASDLSICSIIMVRFAWSLCTYSMLSIQRQKPM